MHAYRITAPDHNHIIRLCHSVDIHPLVAGRVCNGGTGPARGGTAVAGRERRVELNTGTEVMRPYHKGIRAKRPAPVSHMKNFRLFEVGVYPTPETVSDRSP